MKLGKYARVINDRLKTPVISVLREAHEDPESLRDSRNWTSHQQQLRSLTTNNVYYTTFEFEERDGVRVRRHYKTLGDITGGGILVKTDSEEYFGTMENPVKRIYVTLTGQIVPLSGVEKMRRGRKG